MLKKLLLNVGLLAVLSLAGCVTPPASPTSSPPPTETPSPSPTPEATEVVPTTEHDEVMVLPAVDIGATPVEIPPYDRSEWRQWVDVDSDCQDARHEVLVIESVISVTFREGGECFVIGGQWIDPYTGIEVTDPSEFDIDHMVPLQNVHISGGWQWDRDRKEAYANHLEYDDHLIAVTASANRSKGSKGPHEWKPPLESYWCDYAADWVNIKAEWDLFVAEEEWAALLEMLDTCEVAVVFDDGSTDVSTFTPTPSPEATMPPEQDCVDINTASLEDLQRIAHIGEARASEVISLRPFDSVEDLSRVAGIGPSRINDILAQGLACVG